VSDATDVERVLQIHTRYREPGGEDGVVEAERRLLEAGGVQVRQVIFDNADLHEGDSILGDARLALSAVWNRAAAATVRGAVREFRPDAVHVHNTFAAASPSIYAAAGMPVVQTLHNYRFVCPAATAFRDGRPCTECVGHAVPWPSVLHRSVRGSMTQSAVAAGTLAVHRLLGTFRNHVGAYVALTSFQRGLMIEGGLPAKRIRVVPNFREPDPGVAGAARGGVLYLGRLASEKGIGALIAASDRIPGFLRIAGSGPLESAVARAAGSGSLIRLGRLDANAALDALRGASALVVPSIWFEGFPMVVLEAYATGTPVIASRIGSLAEIVEDGVTGLLAQPDDPEDLARQIRWAVDHPTEMAQFGMVARQRYEERYRGPSHLAALLEVYRDAAETWVSRGGVEAA
jgi:glycosyltransferase involved in cell wall biosynthesis